MKKENKHKIFYLLILATAFFLPKSVLALGEQATGVFALKEGGVQEPMNEQHQSFMTSVSVKDNYRFFIGIEYINKKYEALSSSTTYHFSKQICANGASGNLEIKNTFGVTNAVLKKTSATCSMSVGDSDSLNRGTYNGYVYDVSFDFTRGSVVSSYPYGLTKYVIGIEPTSGAYYWASNINDSFTLNQTSDIQLGIDEINNGIENVIDNQNKNTNEIKDSITSVGSAINSALGGKLDGMMDADISDKDKELPDSSSYEDYEKTEQDLLDKTKDVDLNVLDVGLDVKSSSWVWDTLTSLIESHSAVFGMFVAILSIGVIKLILGR